MSYKLLDKITLYTTNYDKDVTFEEGYNSAGASGCVSYHANECDEYIIYKIVEVKETEFSFETVLDYDGYVCKEMGINEFINTKYHLISLDKKHIVLTEYDLKSLSSEHAKKSYENHLKLINK